MDELVERIAAEIGPKWVQLLSKLCLEGYRDRYKILAQHKGEQKEEQEVNCTRDTIRLWQKGLGGMEEREAITELLKALKRVKGFDKRAQELAESHGLSLDESQSLSISSEDSEKTAEPCGGNSTTTTDSESILRRDMSISAPYPATMPTESSSSQFPTSTHHHTITPPHSFTSPPLSHPHYTRHTKNSDEIEIGSEFESLHGDQTSTPSDINKPGTYNRDQHRTTPSLMPHSTSTTAAGIELLLENSEVLSESVDISVWKHKFVLLDVCQRLQCGLSELAMRLGVSEKRVNKLLEDQSMGKEEQFYQVLKAWLMDEEEQGKEEEKKEEKRKLRTFSELKEVLDACQQQTVGSIIVKRLLSLGLTIS